MEKICLFCGNPPKRKSMEHVIPQWLIELTGELKRKISLGKSLTNDTPSIREYSFNSFKFPSCVECNNKFSKLENDAKSIIKKMVEKKPVQCTELSILLDWLDKVRIGLWLAFLYLDRNPLGIVPNFHISLRVGASDRMVAIYCASDEWEGINFLGVNTPSFWLLPSCFTLVINDLYFLNLAAPYLISRRIGFPYPKNAYILEDKKTYYEIYPGLERHLCPLIKRPFMKPCKEIYQPVFGNNEEIRLLANRLYDTDYVHENCLDWDKGVGKVFIQEGTTLKSYPDKQSIDWYPNNRIERDYLHLRVAIQTFEFQNYLMKLGPSDEKLAKENRKVFKIKKNFAKEANNIIILNAKSRLKEIMKEIKHQY